MWKPRKLRVKDPKDKQGEIARQRSKADAKAAKDAGAEDASVKELQQQVKALMESNKKLQRAQSVNNDYTAKAIESSGGDPGALRKALRQKAKKATKKKKRKGMEDEDEEDLE